MAKNQKDVSTLFSDKPDLYAAARPTYPQALFTWIAEQSPDTDTVWDCATGNGQGAVGLVDFFDIVEATDISDSQLSHAFPHPQIRYSKQPAERTTFADSYFDTIHVAQALHWFDYEKFWPEVHRVLKPGGFFVAHSYDLASVTPEVDQAIREHLLIVLKSYWSPGNKIAQDGYKSIPFPLDPIIPPSIPFTMSWDLDQLFNFFHTWSATRKLMKEAGDDFFVDAYTKVQKVWGSPNQKRMVTFPFNIIAGRHS